MLEMWGGHECTVNRVKDRFRDQTIASGHQTRSSDIDLFADLGISVLRYPLLWERIAPHAPGERDWSWSDARLAAIRERGLRPIGGLLHHGSGPAYTSLIASNFVEGLADHARAVAERYPWVTDWTPVNEPLTTARFSALYGHWYPHASDEPTFWLALLNQIEAVGAAMREVRKVNPSARLIQTEDLGQAYGTPPLAAEVEFQNERRWITWDLLCGRVIPGHSLWPKLEALGFASRLDALALNPCPPDVLGVNFYITSERFLDHRAELYPQWTAGALGQFDMDALRVLDPEPVGLDGLLRQAWARFGIPIAITESHLNGPLDDQLRWLMDAWSTALRLRNEGVDILAVTSWALLGSYDWNSLLTQHTGFYEPGAFSVVDGVPHPTQIAALVRHLANGGTVAAWLKEYPELKTPGWWRQPGRLTLPPYKWREELVEAG